jgi:putative membrane-bound dehydrogenase-like protein
MQPGRPRYYLSPGACLQKSWFCVEKSANNLASMNPVAQLRFLRPVTFACAAFALAGIAFGGEASKRPPSSANRLTYLDESDPFYVGLDFPKLTTPQWIGESGVEAVIVLAIDDLREAKKYETFLRPILEKLKHVEGTAALSIMCNQLRPDDPQFQTWLKEGVSLEVHTLTHPCPLLAKTNFAAAAETYHGGVDLLNQIPGNQPVAFRMPCCDSMNSPSPRFYAEIFNRVSGSGRFLTLDSSVMNIPSSADKSLPRELLVDAGGRERFRKYVPFPSFTTTVDDYPYPYVIGKLCWEFPGAVPSDWAAQHLHGTNNPVTVADWEAALDMTVLKQGVFNLIFHPHGWIRNDQIVELIDYAVRKHGKKIKFLSFRDAQAHLNRNLLDGHPLRAANGKENGVRLVDVNNDGYLDVIVANERARKTRIWKPAAKSWTETDFPIALVMTDAQGNRDEVGARFGVLQRNGYASVLVANETTNSAWHFNGNQWLEDRSLLAGLEIDGKPIRTRNHGKDPGVRLRDVDNDGICELIVANQNQNAVLAWSDKEKRWKKLPYALPQGAAIVDAAGRDNGLRFVDVNEDGYADVLLSNEERYSLHLFMPQLYLGFQAGWSREVIAGKRGTGGEFPMIAKNGENNGAWFRARSMWVQNETTASLPDVVDRRSFDQLLAGLQPPPKSPEDSLKCIRIRPGFKVELVAAEPLVKDPINFEWGADGKLWIVEMGDYPIGTDGHGRRGGVVRFLEDTNHDGRYDTSTVFLDGLNFPNGVMPWRKGVLISAAPELLYAEDANGDGKANVRKTLFTGFREGNQQHRFNGFEYGLDNWIYGANGDSGGNIRSAATGKSVSISTRDFRFHPDDGAFEAVAGQTQYGRHHDDWGNWFGNNNSTWIWHFYLPIHYLTRNPHLAVKSTYHVLANYPEATRVFPSSRLLQRFNDIGKAGHVTSGCSAIPYRDEVFGADFASSVFICEPVHNLVHREVLKSDGVSFESHRAPDEQEAEFLASTDNWFRPITARTGPDGALYIADMYRLVIEHPEWIPQDTRKVFDVRAGSDKGRIYRVSPVGVTLRKIPRLDGLNTTALVAALDSPNGWQRDTVQRLLVCAGDKAAIKPLERLAAKANNPKVRLQALCALDGLHGLSPEIIGLALRDAHPAVREHAVRLSEPWLSGISATTTKAGFAKDFSEALLKCVDDENVRVRYQLAFSLGEWKDARAAGALMRLAEHDSNNEPMQTAVMSSAVPHLRPMLERVLVETKSQTSAAMLLEKLLGLAGAMKDSQALTQPLHRVTEPRNGHFENWQVAALGAFLDALDRRGTSLREFQAEAGRELRQATSRTQPLFVQARVTVDGFLEGQSGGPAQTDLLAALRLLGRGQSEQESDINRLAALLSPQFQGELAQSALASLGRLRQPRVAERLLSGWRSYGPTLRVAVIDTILTRPEWTEQFLKAVEDGTISSGQVGVDHRRRLLEHSRSSIREQASKLFSTVSADRKKVIEAYGAVGGLQGNVRKGAELFRQNCASCHRFRNEGNAVGPDLAALTDKSVATLLVAILDPNRAAEARYLGYNAVTKSGREVTGVVAAESPNSITLRAANGIEETILRTELKTFTASGLSLMPEGVENLVKPEDLADLIAYLKGDK